MPSPATGQNFGGELIHPEPESLYALLLNTAASILVIGAMPAAQAIIDLDSMKKLSGARRLSMPPPLLKKWQNLTKGDFRLRPYFNITFFV